MTARPADGGDPGETGAAEEAIDIHAHAIPLDLLGALAREGLADLEGLQKGVVAIDPEISGLPPGSAIPCPPEQYDLEIRLSGMAAMRVSHQVVSAPPYLFATHTSDDRLAVDLVRRVNDSMAVFVEQAPARLSGLGTVPLGRPQAAEEARRALDELSFTGLVVGSAGAGRELDDPGNEDLWALIDERGIFTLLHPSWVSSPERLGHYHLLQLVGYPAETALAAARLVFGGVLERYDLPLCLGHGGGCVRAIGGRLDVGWERKTVARTITQPPQTYLRRLYYDTVVFDPLALRRLIEDVGADHVLLGTDFPFDLSDRAPRETVGILGLPADAEALLLRGNARRLLRLPASAGKPDDIGRA